MDHVCSALPAASSDFRERTFCAVALRWALGFCRRVQFLCLHHYPEVTKWHSLLSSNNFFTE